MMFKDFTGGAKPLNKKDYMVKNIDALRREFDQENEYDDDTFLKEINKLPLKQIKQYVKKNKLPKKEKEYKRINCDLKDKKFFRRGTPMECAKVGKFSYYGKFGMEKNDEINEDLLKIAEAIIEKRVRKRAKKVISEKTNAPPEAVEEMVNEILE